MGEEFTNGICFIDFSFQIIIIVDEEVRECVLLSLDEKFDTHLAQAENLTSLFIAIYDGVSPIYLFFVIYCVCVSFDMNLYPYYVIGFSNQGTGNVHYW